MVFCSVRSRIWMLSIKLLSNVSVGIDSSVMHILAHSRKFTLLTVSGSVLFFPIEIISF